MTTNKTPKFPRGTYVEILPGWPRKAIVGKRFFVDKAEMSVIRDLEDIGGHVAYETPYASATSPSDKAWVFEQFLKEVDLDDGFEFDETVEIWSPHLILSGEQEACRVQ